MKKFLHLLAVVTISLGLVAMFPPIFVQAAENKIIDKDDAVHQYTLPEESTRKYEAAMLDGYVQSLGTSSVFEKVSLKAYSDTLSDYTSGAIQLADGNYAAVVYHQYVNSNGSINVSSSAGSALLMKYDQDGNVLGQMSVANGEATIKDNPGSKWWQQYVSNSGRPMFIQELTNGRYAIYYNGTSPEINSYFVNEDPAGSMIEYIINSTWMLTFDKNLQNPVWTEVGRNTGLSSILKVATNDGSDSGLTFNTVRAGTGSDDPSTGYSIETNIIDNGVVSGQMTFQVPSYFEFFGSEPRGVVATHTNILNITKIDSGGYIARVYLYDTGVRAGTGHAMETAFALIHYDDNGAIQWVNFGNYGGRYLPALSNSEYVYYFDNDAALARYKVADGSREVIQQYASGTSLYVEKDNNPVHGTPYIVYGYASAMTGPFTGFGEGSGVVLGTMNANLSVKSLNIADASGNIRFESFLSDEAGNIFANGTVDAATTDFADAPAGGWKAKTTNAAKSNVFFGGLRSIDDYAPGIKTNGKLTINKDEVTDWDSALLSGVSVTDTFDLSAVGGKSQAWLNSRINRNPLNTSLDYDWAALGLNKDAVGFNKVSYFVTDSKNQASVTSRGVNVVAKSTEYDDEENVALDAHNFAIDIKDVAGLNEALAKTNADVSAWDMNDGSDLTADVTADAGELAAIQGATKANPYPLTFTVTKNGITVTNTITVFVTDDNTVIDEDQNVVLYADNFIQQLSEAAALTDANAKAVDKANPRAYVFETGAALSKDDISVDASAVRAATEVGPVWLPVVYQNADKTVSTTVIANIVDENTTVDEDKGEALHAKNFTIDVSEVAGLDVAAVNTLASAKAWNLNNGNNVTFTTDYSAILAANGQYPVVFTTAAGTTRTVVATVIGGEESSVELDAKNFAIALEDTAGLTEALAKTNAQVSAKNSANTDLTASVVANSAQLAAIQNAIEAKPFLLTFTVTENDKTASKVITVFVTDENTVIDDDIVLYAKGFSVGLSEAASVTDERGKTLADPHAYVFSTGVELPRANISADASNVRAATAAGKVSVPVRYSDNSASVATSVMATIIDDLPPVVNPAIDANNFIIHINEVANLNESAAKTKANARAWIVENARDLSPNIAVNQNHLTTIQRATEVKPYVLQFAVTEGQKNAAKTVVVFVKDDDTTVDEEKNEAIYAKSFSIHVNAVSGLNVDAILNLTGAKAWDLNTGSEIPFTTDYTAIQAKKGEYPVTFTTEAGTTRTVTATVVDDAQPATDNNNNLPTTGQDLAAPVFIGGIMVIAGVVLAVRKKEQ